MSDPETPPTAATPMWDIAVRVTHWLFVLLIPALWWTGEQKDLETHKLIGFVMLGLVVFRLLWGILGSSTARFAGFVTGPGRLIGYVRSLFGKHGDETVGHNPLGAWSVIALLSLLGAMVGTGLFAEDVDGLDSGPLTRLVEYETSEAVRVWHHQLFDLLLIIIGVHVVAILFYLLVKRDNLVWPMITGKKRFRATVDAVRFAPWWVMLACAAVAAGLAWWVSKGAYLP